MLGVVACSDAADPKPTPDAGGGGDAGGSDAGSDTGAVDSGLAVEGGCAPGESSVVPKLLAQTIPNPTGFTVVPNNGQLLTVLQSDDTDTSYVSRLDAAATLRFSHAAFVLPAGKKVTSLNIRARARRTTFATGGGINLGVFFKSRPVATATFASDTKAFATTWSVAEHKLAQNPAEPGDWTSIAVNDLEIAVVFDPQSATNAVLVSYLTFELCVL